MSDPASDSRFGNGDADSDSGAPDPSPGRRPTVTLVVPCRDETATLAETIASICEQDYPSNLLELLLIDGGSGAALVEAVAAVRRHRPRLRVRIVPNPDRITPVAFNIGVAAARGDVIFTLGAHTSYSPNYVSGAVAALARHSADAVGSCALTVPGAQTPVARAIARALASPFGVGGSRMRTGSDRAIVTDTASCPGYRRQVFERIGLFNTALVRNQDIDFNLRLRRAGLRLVLEPAITSHYRARGTLRALWHNCFANGYWVIRSLRFTRFAFRPRHLTPLAACCAGVVGLSVAIAGQPLPLLLTVGGYLLADARIAWRRRDPLLAVVFPCIHLAYGVGSLWALMTLLVPPPARPAAVGSQPQPAAPL